MCTQLPSAPPPVTTFLHKLAQQKMTFANRGDTSSIKICWSKLLELHICKCALSHTSLGNAVSPPSGFHLTLPKLYLADSGGQGTKFSKLPGNKYSNARARSTFGARAIAPSLRNAKRVDIFRSVICSNGSHGSSCCLSVTPSLWRLCDALSAMGEESTYRGTFLHRPFLGFHQGQAGQQSCCVYVSLQRTRTALFFLFSRPRFNSRFRFRGMMRTPYDCREHSDMKATAETTAHNGGVYVCIEASKKRTRRQDPEQPWKILKAREKNKTKIPKLNRTKVGHVQAEGNIAQ